MLELEKKLREEIINIGKRLYDSRLVVAKGGNLSGRIDKNTIFITATSVSLGHLQEEDIIKVDLSSEADKQNKRLSTEFLLHSVVYKNFSNINRVIHCHPPLTNGYFSVYDDIEILTYETKLYLGKIPVVKQSTPAVTNPQEVIDCLKTSNIVAIKNHGVVATGKDFLDGLHLIENLEEAVRMVGLARIFKKEKLDSFEAEFKKDLSAPISESIYEMFSSEHIQAIVDLVNKDEFISQKGEELDLTIELAIKLQEDESKVYKFHFKKGKIIKLEYDNKAPFMISAPADVWRLIFLGKLDPFVATTQGKMKLKGELGKLSRWYVPFSRLFELFKGVKIK